LAFRPEGSKSSRTADAGRHLEVEPDDNVIALKELIGHVRIDQTLVYPRRKDKPQAMEAVRTRHAVGRPLRVPPPEVEARKKPPLSRGFGEEAHTGFEPVPPP
jgi:hypothetical protein